MKSIKKTLMTIENKPINGVYNVGSQFGYTINNIIKFYFGTNVFKTAQVFDEKIIKSQTLSIKKINKILRFKKNEFHKQTKRSIIKMQKILF